MSTPQNIDITSRLLAVKLVHFSTETPEAHVKINPLEFNFRYEINVKQDPDINGFRIKCKTSVFSNKDQNILLGTIETIGEFEVLNLNKILEHFKGTPTDLLAIFTGVVISSTRGMLIIKSENTILEGALIPLLDPKVFFTPEAEKSVVGKNTEKL